MLFAAGITDRLYRPEEDMRLLDLGIGFTNVCPTIYNYLRSRKFLARIIHEAEFC